MIQPDFHWRQYTENDRVAAGVLDEACEQFDGEDAVPLFMNSLIPAQPDSDVICAVSSGEHLVALGSVALRDATAILRGKVHPGCRQQGLGSYLLHWQEERARELGNPATLTIRTEALLKGASTLYTQHGYQVAMIENWMRRDLSDPVPDIATTFTHVPWQAENINQFFETYRTSFSDRPGFPDPERDEWISDYTTDEDFRPDLSLLTFDQALPIGFIMAEISHMRAGKVGVISQIGVRPTHRRQGVAAALIVQTLRAFHAKGLGYVDLHVNINNPGAMRLYEHLGFRVLGQRAKFIKAI